MKKLTTAELGRELGYSRPTVVAWAKSGQIPKSCIRRTDGGAAYRQLRFLNNGVLRRWITLNTRQKRNWKRQQNQAQKRYNRFLTKRYPYGLRLAVNAYDELVLWLRSRPEGFWEDEKRRDVWNQRLKALARLIPPPA